MRLPLFKLSLILATILVQPARSEPTYAFESETDHRSEDEARSSEEINRIYTQVQTQTFQPTMPAMTMAPATTPPAALSHGENGGGRQISKNQRKIKLVGSSAHRDRKVETKNGVVEGKEVKVKKYRTVLVESPTEKTVYGFFGIPYARPPLGDLRFKRPVKPANWQGTREAKTLPNSCPQVISNVFPGFLGEEQWNANTKLSEDCLYLNIWVPASAFEPYPRNASTSVMFWIHAGGFHTGTSTLEMYDGASLASENGVIVVSVQYRLGALGFLYFGIDEAPGNLGLIDQTFALQWVNDNIAAFGGNPDEVTIFGTSAGASCVTHHLLTPLSRSLFKRAIIMSGVATASWSFRTKSESFDISSKIAKDVGCLFDDVLQIVDCMRKASVDALLAAQVKDAPKFVEEIPLYPTIDDYFLTDTPENLLKNWDTRRADIIMGTTQDEGTYFLMYAYLKYVNRVSKSNISYDVFTTILRDIFHDRPAYEMDAIVTKYTNWQNPEDGGQNQMQLAYAIGDAFFTCPAQDFAQKWAGRGSNVWYYDFGMRSLGNHWGEWMGVLHGDDVEYAFGRPLRSPDRPQIEMDLSLHFMILLTNFAKEGVPSQHWEKYSANNQVFLNLNGTKITDQSTPGLFGPRAAECGFWNNYLPRLRQTMEQANKGHPHVKHHGRTCSGGRSAHHAPYRHKFGQ